MTVKTYVMDDETRKHVTKITSYLLRNDSEEDEPLDSIAHVASWLLHSGDRTILARYLNSHSEGEKLSDVEVSNMLT